MLSRRGLLQAAAAGLIGTALQKHVPATTTATPGQAGRFTVAAGNIIGPDGKRFRSLGANVGVPGAFDWKGALPDPRALPALKAWGWNTVKPSVYSPAHMPQVDSYGALEKIVTELTPAGMVVQVVNRDNSDREWYAYDEANTVTFWKTVATKYADNPHVWFCVTNEPKEHGPAWTAYHQKMIDTIREAGAENLIVLDPATAGQDVGPEYEGHEYFLDSAARLTDVGHAVYSPHTYGWAKWQKDPATFEAWIAKHKAAGWPVVVGEFGWTANGTSTAGSYDVNLAAGQNTIATWKAGSLDGLVIWHGTHGDLYATQADGGAFWDGAAGVGLSSFGQALRGL